MTSAKRIAAMTLGGALVLASNPIVLADSLGPQMMKPLAAVSLDAGAKHVIGYFVSADGACKLTLAVNEGGDDAALVSTSRLQVSVDAGKSAKFDSAEGRTLVFTCKPSAQAMTAVAIDRLAASE